MMPENPPTIPSPPSTRMIHYVFLAMSLTIMLLSFAMSSDGRQTVTLPGFTTPLPELCSSKAYLGISCPGCGLTRSFIAISHGEFTSAWRLNPASLLVYTFVAIQIPWQIFQLWRIRTGKPIIESLWVFAPLLACMLGLVIQWVTKLSLGMHVT